MKTFLTVICLAVLPTIAFAYNVEVDGIYYDLDTAKKTATVEKNRANQYSGTIVIPEAISYNGTKYIVTSIGLHAFSECTGLTSVTIPNSVTSIGDYAFSNCKVLKSIIIPNSVVYIGSNAFGNCSKLASVTIGSSVVTIGDGAFRECGYLTMVVIPNSVKTIGRYAFCYTELTSVIIPTSVTSIGESAFYGCYELASVSIPNSIASIGDNTFSNCYGLKSVIIPNSVTSIGDGAFYSCKGLTSVSIPNSVRTIGDSAFRFCSGLSEELIIPLNVESVGKRAFSYCTEVSTITVEGAKTILETDVFDGCSNIKTVNVHSTQPPVGKDDTFATKTYNDAILYVPKSAKDAYARPACWRNFNNVIEKDFGGVDDVTADEDGICVNVLDGQVEVSGADASEEIRVYDMSGLEIYHGTDRTIALPTKGVYIVKVAGRSFKVAL